MQSWEAPVVPQLPEPLSFPVLIHDSATQQLENSAPSQHASFYACGITPYDATHIGHANTYVAFDLLYRAWLDAGKQVQFAQNITDVDDPLLERALATGVDWRQLAREQTQLFRDDMTALRVMPPQNWITVTEAMPQIIDAVTQLVNKKASYFDSNYDISTNSATAQSHDVYFDISTDKHFGSVSNLPYPEMLERFEAHGGDPERPGKHSELDPILWRAHRPEEPAWDGGLIGIGRPGWHIGCAVIANQALGRDFDVTGGGRDLLFPHHEMSASLARVLYHDDKPTDMPLQTDKSTLPGARRFMHCGLISYQGEKMSKSLGNLVLVSKLRAAGVDPMAIRLTLLSHHYREDWEWTDQQLVDATQRLALWRSALASPRDFATPTVNTDATPEPSDTQSDNDVPSQAENTIAAMRAALANDLNAPKAIDIVENYFASTNRTRQGDQLVKIAVDALLGIAL